MRRTEAELRAVLTRTPQMNTLLGADFNQDWMLDWQSAEDVLICRIDEVDSARKRALLREVKSLLSALETDQDVEDFLDFVGSGLVPTIDFAQSARAWLCGIRDRLQDGLEITD